MRKENELPLATEKWGWKYHHTGIPTKKPMPGERYIPQFGMFVCGFPESPFGIEFMRFEKNSQIHPYVQQNTHVAFVVDDIEVAIEKSGCEVLCPPNPPSEGVQVAMLRHGDAVIEIMKFE